MIIAALIAPTLKKNVFNFFFMLSNFLSRKRSIIFNIIVKITTNTVKIPKAINFFSFLLSFNTPLSLLKDKMGRWRNVSYAQSGRSLFVRRHCLISKFTPYS